MDHPVGGSDINVDDVDSSAEAIGDGDSLAVNVHGPTLTRQGLNFLATEGHHVSSRDVARHHVVEEDVFQQLGIVDQGSDQIVHRKAQLGGFSSCCGWRRLIAAACNGGEQQRYGYDAETAITVDRFIS